MQAFLVVRRSSVLPKPSEAGLLLLHSADEEGDGEPELPSGHAEALASVQDPCSLVTALSHCVASDK